MKSKKLFSHLPRIFILIILIGVVVTSTSLTPDSQRRMREFNTDELIQVIDGWLDEFVSADESDRFNKINAFMALSDFQSQLSDNDLLCERVESEFAVALNHIVEWFFDDYLSMVDVISEGAAENIGEIRQYLSDLSADIDRLSELFIFVSDDQVGEPADDPADDPVDEPTDGSADDPDNEPSDEPVDEPAVIHCLYE